MNHQSHDRTQHWPRDVPSLSEAANRSLRTRVPAAEFPDTQDTEGWLELVGEKDAADAAVIHAVAPPMPVEWTQVAGVPVAIATPGDSATHDAPLVVNFHGGALAFQGGALLSALARLEAALYGAPVWSVDYRMPPLHPFPAGVEDATRAYEEIVRSHDPGRVVLSGASAGGNIAAAVLLRALDEGLPLPAAVVLLSPEADLTESGDSFTTLAEWDNTLGSLQRVNELYAGGRRLDDPLVSPLFGDFTDGPPVFLQSGTRDLFLSNTVRLHRRMLDQGVPAELHIFEGRPHVGFGGAPEDADLGAAVRRFLAAHVHLHRRASVAKTKARR